jgi:hypothetical protein
MQGRFQNSVDIFGYRLAQLTWCNGIILIIFSVWIRESGVGLLLLGYAGLSQYSWFKINVNSGIFFSLTKLFLADIFLLLWLYLNSLLTFQTWMAFSGGTKVFFWYCHNATITRRIQNEV